jgi:hypothetical protein
MYRRGASYVNTPSHPATDRGGEYHAEGEGRLLNNGGYGGTNEPAKCNHQAMETGESIEDATHEIGAAMSCTASAAEPNDAAERLPLQLDIAGEYRRRSTEDTDQYRMHMEMPVLTVEGHVQYPSITRRYGTTHHVSRGFAVQVEPYSRAMRLVEMTETSAQVENEMSASGDGEEVISSDEMPELGSCDDEEETLDSEDEMPELVDALTESSLQPNTSQDITLRGADTRFRILHDETGNLGSRAMPTSNRVRSREHHRGRHRHIPTDPRTMSSTVINEFAHALNTQDSGDGEYDSSYDGGPYSSDEDTGTPHQSRQQ